MTARLGREMEPGVGVLAHVTSLPAEAGEDAGAAGTLSAAWAFIDWLADAGVRYWQILPLNPTDRHRSPYAGVSAFAGNTQLLGPNGGGASAAALDDDAFTAFCELEADWLEPYVAFMAGDDADGRDELRRTQFAFEEQWRALHDHAQERGVLIVGDMPIYVGAGSADVRAHPELFRLGPDGEPDVVAGCPPDDFAPRGQVWNNPVYDWNALRENGYAWWLRRLERAFQLYDFVRLDHFIGFSRYFAIPARQPASTGEYHAGPGIELFESAHAAFGELPIIAEDLGLLTDDVRRLVAACGFPGMDVVQFAHDPLGGYQPGADRIAYTGTHDNQTLVGYCRTRYPHLDAHAAAADLMSRVAMSPAPVCVFPLQDLMGLDDEARMNTPGVAEGNWGWQADPSSMPRAWETARSLVLSHREAHSR